MTSQNNYVAVNWNLGTTWTRLPNMGVTGRFCNLSAAQCLGPTHGTDHACKGAKITDGGSKAANFSSTLIISCASCAQRNFSLLSQNTCGMDLAGVWGRSWMRLGAFSLLLPHRRLRSAAVVWAWDSKLWAWDRNSKLLRQLPGWLSISI